MNTAENNKLIVEFIGYSQPHPDYPDTTYWYKKEQPPLTILSFDTDWNWLMLVVEKIENTKYNNLTFDVFISKNKTHIHYSANNEWFSNIFLHEGKTKIENTYNACVEFIKWYNEQK